MANFDKLTDELAGKAVLATGVSAAKRALQDALLTEDERAAREAELARTKKSGRTKLIAYAVIGLMLVIGAIGLALSYWHWFLLAGLASAAALYARSRLRKRREPRAEVAVPVEREVIAAPDSVPRVLARREPPTKLATELPTPRPPPAEDAEVEAEAVDAELAAMKARLRKG